MADVTLLVAAEDEAVGLEAGEVLVPHVGNADFRGLTEHVEPAGGVVDGFDKAVAAVGRLAQRK
jgi:hypothetical protein